MSESEWMNMTPSTSENQHQRWQHWAKNGGTETHVRQSSSRTEPIERYLRYSDHLWHFLGG